MARGNGGSVTFLQTPEGFARRPDSRDKAPLRHQSRRAVLPCPGHAAGRAAPRRAAPPAADLVGYYKGFAIDLLRRAGELDKPVLLAVDGLDEAAGWRLDPALLPHEPAPNLRVLVSARQQAGDIGGGGWLERLRWNRLGPTPEAVEVARLDVLGITDVLRRMGAALAVITEDSATTAQITRLTGGDPLLVRLYAEDLQKGGGRAGRLRPEDLANLKPGFGPFFRDWLADQEALWEANGRSIHHDTVDLVLALLACALGPLRHADLAHLCRRRRGEGFVLQRRALGALERFVLGDGFKQGYVLAHPKFADHLRQDYFADPAIVEAARAAFLEWGRDTLARLNTGKLSPETCPPYLLLYFGQHLDEAGAPAADFMGLVEEGWLRAWEALEGGYRGFSQDVRRATDAAARPDAECGQRWAWRFRCQLVLGSIANIGSQVPGELLARCVASGLLSPRQALHWSECQPHDSARASALGGLAPYLPGTLLAEALQAAIAIGDHRARAHALCALAPHLPEALLAEALQAAKAIGDDQARAEALGTLAPHLPEAERARALTEALQVASAVGNDLARSEALGALAPHLQEAERAGVLAEALPGRHGRPRRVGPRPCLGRPRPALAGTRARRRFPPCPLTPSCPPLLAEALVAAKALQGDVAPRPCLGCLCPHLAEAERDSVFTQALRTAMAGELDAARALDLSVLAPYLPEALLADALRAAMAIGDHGARARALGVLAPHLPETERTDVLAEALQVASEIGDNWVGAFALQDLAPLLPKTLLADALRVARAIENEGIRASTLETLAPRLPQALLAEALRIACAFEDERLRVYVLGALAPYLPQALLAEALRAARAIGDDADRARALGDLAPRLPELERANLLAEALGTARAVGDARTRAWVLGVLAPRLPEPERAGVLAEALRAASAVADDRGRGPHESPHFHWLSYGRDSPTFEERPCHGRMGVDCGRGGTCEWAFGRGPGFHRRAVRA